MEFNIERVAFDISARDVTTAKRSGYLERDLECDSLDIGFENGGADKNEYTGPD